MLEEEVEEEERYYLPDPALPMRFRPLKCYNKKKRKVPLESDKNPLKNYNYNKTQHITVNEAVLDKSTENNKTEPIIDDNEANQDVMPEIKIEQVEEEENEEDSSNNCVI